MTLDEAIAISDEIGKGDTERAANNRWLAQQLRMLKWVEDCHIIGEAQRARADMHKWQSECVKLKDENDKLRKLVLDMRYNSTWTDEAREHIDGVLRELGIEDE